MVDTMLFNLCSIVEGIIIMDKKLTFLLISMICSGISCRILSLYYK